VTVPEGKGVLDSLLGLVRPDLKRAEPKLGNLDATAEFDRGDIVELLRNHQCTFQTYRQN
jgi:hypothetical protein